MRNLLGRLHARSPEDIERIAAFWQVPWRDGDRHGGIGRLYRTLTDPRAARAVWDRLAEDERALVRLLALGKEPSLTLAEIAERLAIPEAEAHQLAARLFRIGLVAREGDDEPLPVGSAPCLFLPRELQLLFQRLQDEIEAGDLSTTPLRALLELLDDAELEEAAQIWGLTVIPGLRERADLTRQLLRQVTLPGRVEAVATKRRRDAALIWHRVRDEPNGAPVALPDAAASVGLDGADPRQGQRLRDALAALETALLVWHTYRPDGSRWLFIPAEIRQPSAAASTELPPLTPVAAPIVERSPWRHPHALAWDLLTLLRELTAPDAPPWTDALEMPRAWLRRLNRRLWLRDEDVPPPGTLDLLISLAHDAQLLRQDEQEGVTRFGLGSGMRAWRELTFPQQTEQLWSRWLESATWVEGRARDRVEVWGADWRGYRHRLLPLLTDLTAETWYPVESVATRIAAREPELLGAAFTAATARHSGATDGDGDGRQAAVAEVVATTLETGLTWFGIVDWAAVPGYAGAIRLTPAGIAILGRSALPAERPRGDRPLEVRPNLEILLHQPAPLHVWSLALFAEPRRLERVSVYQVSAESLGRALGAGFDLPQVTAFLAKQGRAPLTPETVSRLEEWAHGYRRVRLRRAILLTPDEPSALTEISDLVEKVGLRTAHLDDGTLLVELPESGDDRTGADDAVLRLLHDRGYTPQWTKPTGRARKP